MISEMEKGQIKAIVQSPQWGAVQHLADDLCRKIQDDKNSRDTEWESLRVMLNSEGQIEGIKRFIQELFKTLE